MPDAGRVITGAAGGLRLDAPGPATRPISDKAKQALFSILESERPDIWERPFLDLFAGSGAIGIEALSRGAPAAVLVERDGRAVGTIRRNLERTRLGDTARVVRRDVLAYLAEGPTPGPGAGPDSKGSPVRFGAAVLDPPYAQVADLLTVLEQLGDPNAGWLEPGALVATKHFWKDAPPPSIGTLVRLRERRFGETALSVYRRASEPAAGGR